MFSIPDKYKKEYDTRLFHTEEETNNIIDEMIYNLQMMDEDFVEKVLYGNNILDDNYHFKTPEETKLIFSTMDQHKEKFMELFSDYFWQLWD